MIRSLTLINTSFMLADYDTCLKIVIYLCDLFESNPRFCDKFWSNYLKTLGNLVQLRMINGENEDGKRILKKIDQLMKPESKIDFRVKLKLLFILLGFAINENDLESGKDVVYEIEVILGNQGHLLVPDLRITAFYFVAYFKFLTREYSTSLIWINRLFRQKKSNLRKDLQCAARLFNLILHLEIGNLDFLDYEIRNTKTFLARKDNIFKFEKIFLAIISDLTRGNEKQEILDRLIKHHDSLNELWKDPWERNLIHFFDLEKWIEEKKVEIK